MAQIERPKFYTLPVNIETALSKDALNANPHFRKLVNVCLNTLGASPLHLYENGHDPNPLATLNNPHFFSYDHIAGKRGAEIPQAQVDFIPDHIIGQDGQRIMVKTVMKKGQTEYWQMGEDGKLLLTEKEVAVEGKKAEKTGIKVDPGKVISKKYVDRETGDEVVTLSDRDILKEEISELAAFHLVHLISAPQTEADTKQWLDTIEVVPDLIKLLSHEGSHIEAVQRSHVLNIASAAMQIAANPQTRVKIVAGFGASNTERSNCYVANALPALEMADKMRVYFEKRQAKGKSGLTNPPIVEFVFAKEAGIQANYQDEADFVRSFTADNIAHVQRFARDFYPAVPIAIASDLIWEDLSPQTAQIIKYYASILRHHPSKDIEATLKNLVKFGHGKGSNGSNRDTAAEYAAIHPLVWGFKPSYAQTQYLDNETPADVVVRIGPRAEIKFDAMIMTIRQWEDKDAFAKFIQEPQDRVAPVNQNGPTTVLLISSVGRHGPSYFRYAYDGDLSQPIEQTRTALLSEINSLNETSDKSEAAEKRACLKARVSDLDLLIAVRESRLEKIALGVI